MEERRILLLGPPQVELGEKTAAIKLRKAAALLAYLAVEDRAFSREHLAALLWPELPHAKALSNLRRILTSIRTLLQNGSIVTDGDQVRLDHVLVDVDEFRSLILQSHDHDPRHLERATAIYRGDFLEGFNLGDCAEFDEWQDGVRERFRLEYESSLETICRIHIENGDCAAALPYARMWLEHDHWSEPAHRALMTIHREMGHLSTAIKQFEDCREHLAEDDLEPDATTMALYRELIDLDAKELRNTDTEAGAQGRSTGQTQKPVPRRSQRKWLLAAAGLVVLAGLSLAIMPVLRRNLAPADISVRSIEIARESEELTGVGIVFDLKRPVRRNITFDIVFSTDGSIGINRDYAVYSDRFDLAADRRVSTFVGAETQIAWYVYSHSVPIPPGWYTASVRAAPIAPSKETRPADNVLASSEVFYFAGADPDMAVQVVIEHASNRQINSLNPLRIFIGGPLPHVQTAAYSTVRPGTFFLPIGEPLSPIDHDSELFLVLIHDVGGDLAEMYDVGPGDLAGIRGQGPGNLDYGTFTIFSGSPVRLGSRHHIVFGLADLPDADPFENDNTLEEGTVIDYSTLPIRHRRTFHDKGDGTEDWDWYTVFLRDGDSILIETLSVQEGWESDTAIDLNNERDGYITSGSRPGHTDQYDQLAYVNNTGHDQFYYICIHPRNKTDTIINHKSGEYYVQFQR